MQSVYDGMAAAYSGGNIGPISNSISKIWNSENPDLDTIKRLCYRNNEVIDYAKCLYKSIPPKDIAKQLSAATNQLLPHFFIYAKDKNKSQVNPPNNSPVNRLKKIIPHFKFNFRRNKFGKFDFHMLMNNPTLLHTNHVDELIREYNRLASNIKASDNETDDNTYFPQYLNLRNKLFEMATNNKYVVDAIIFGIFNLRKSKHKKAFWGAFGDIVLENLKLNLSKQCDDMILCRRCYTRFIPEDDRMCCPHCGSKHRDIKPVICVDCGEEFMVDIRNTNKIRCNRCQNYAERDNTRARVAKFRKM